MFVKENERTVRRKQQIFISEINNRCWTGRYSRRYKNIQLYYTELHKALHVLISSTLEFMEKARTGVVNVEEKSVLLMKAFSKYGGSGWE